MDETRWAQIQAAFDEVVELEPSKRALRLAQLCHGDPDLRRSVERLLEGGEPATDPFGLSGRAVSHFRVLESLGAGGMGVVYRAEDLRLHSGAEVHASALHHR